MKAFIIDEIAKEEVQERARLEIPIESIEPDNEPLSKPIKKKSNRGVITINIWDDEDVDEIVKKRHRPDLSEFLEE